MQKIDAHQHFWQYDPVAHSWIPDESIKKDFMPEDLYPVLQKDGIDGCVLVQVDQTEAENNFQLQNAEKFDFIKGYVGWVDLQSEDVAEKLSYYKSFDKIKGFRHILQGETDRALMLKPAFTNGIGLLKQFGFTYDILIFPDQLKYAADLVRQFPDQPFVIDHIAKPYIKDGLIDDWKTDMEAMAQYENVLCKISGMVTEADHKNWKKEQFTPYLDVVVKAFGTNRIMYGSDWPVCLAAGSYEAMKEIADDYFASFTEDEQNAFWGGNAIKFYRLEE